MEAIIVPVFGMLIPIVMFICVFSYLAYANRANNRRKEEEARARYEFLRRLAEGGGFDVQKFLEFERAEEVVRRRRAAEKMMLNGMVLTAVGVAAVPFFYFVTEPYLATIGVFPLLIGVTLFLGAQWMARRSSPPER